MHGDGRLFIVRGNRLEAPGPQPGRERGDEALAVLQRDGPGNALQRYQHGTTLPIISAGELKTAPDASSHTV